MRAHKKLFIPVIFFIVAIFVLWNSSTPVDAHNASHLLCQTTANSEVDIVGADTDTHVAFGDSGVQANENYPFDDNTRPDPIGNIHPAGDWPVFKVINNPPFAQYSPDQTYFEGAPAACNYYLQCKTSCDRQIVSGLCDSNCNIESAQCLSYGRQAGFTVTNNNQNATIDWDDGQPQQAVPADPNPQTIQKTFFYPGKYDVKISCGGQMCHKRIHVTCQTSPGGNPTPTSFPTATPTPTNWPAQCDTGLTCSHPCACDPSSSSYVNVGCTGDLANDIGKLNTSSNAGTYDGAACAPGLVCCTAPAASANSVWFKTKDASYHELGALSNDIPSGATAYNASDTGLCDAGDPSSLACHGINYPGLLTAEGAISLGDGTPNWLLWEYGDVGYSYTPEYTPDSYIQYLLSRSDVVTINDPSEVQTKKINYLDATLLGEISLGDDNGFQGAAPFVLLIDNGDFNITVPTNFNNSNASMAFVVDGSIGFVSTLTTANGIFFANTFDFATDLGEGFSTTDPLRINGNIISQTNVDCTSKRQRTDNTKPSCFFTHDFVNQYLPLLDLFSVRTFSRTSY